MSETQYIKAIQDKYLTIVSDEALNGSKRIAEDNYFIVNKVLCNGQKIRLTSKNAFFKTDIIYKVYHDRIEFSHPGLDYRARTVKPSYSKNWYRLDIVAELPEGKYKINEDSNEDLLILDF